MTRIGFSGNMYTQKITSTFRAKSTDQFNAKDFIGKNIDLIDKFSDFFVHYESNSSDTMFSLAPKIQTPIQKICEFQTKIYGQ